MEKGEADIPEVVEDVDREQLVQFVTTIKSPVEQVGEHIISALHHDNTVAVLTTVVRGPNGEQSIVSAALDPSMMTEVKKVLAAAQEAREPEEPCVGFHCLVKPKQEGAASPAPNASPGPNASQP